MTTRDHARPLSPREAREAASRPAAPEAGTSAQGPLPPPTLSLPERLLNARERKGVDLYRAERDTKIRATYLAALERGDDRDLPGPVYTRGFLRNYAIYLGLDPDDVIRQWRDERGAAARPSDDLEMPRPLAEPRKGLTFSPGLLVAALLTVAVVAFIAYLGVQLVRFAKPPTIQVTDPATAVLSLDEAQAEYTFAGTSIPGATIEITASGRDQPYRATAGPDGSWTKTVEISRGRNQFVVDAKDPETGKPSETPVQRVIMVPFPVIEAPTLTVDSPTEGAIYENGAIPVSGHTTNSERVTVVALPLPADGAAASPAPSAVTSPSPAPVPSPSAAASPAASPDGSPTPSPLPDGAVSQDVAPADDGSFAVPLELTTGRWSITVTAASSTGKTVSVTRTVEVAYSGVNVVVSIEGGRAWLKVWVDGKLDPSFGAAGKVLGDGKSASFSGQRSVEVRTGNSGVTSFSLNGDDLGILGKKGQPETWLFAPPAPPEQTGRK
jgi:cytoskeletal protein RodZ